MNRAPRLTSKEWETLYALVTDKMVSVDDALADAIRDLGEATTPIGRRNAKQERIECQREWDALDKLADKIAQRK
jgi:hypothetical protein